MESLTWPLASGLLTLAGSESLLKCGAPVPEALLPVEALPGEAAGRSLVGSMRKCWLPKLPVQT